MGSGCKQGQTRQMVVRYAETSPATITEFGCSTCSWSFPIEHPAPGPVRAELLESAEEAYDIHTCPAGSRVPAQHNTGTEREATPSLQGSKMVN